MADSKKIDAALSKLSSAAKEAFKVLNEAADKAYEGSAAEADPVRHAHEIAINLQLAKAELEAQKQLDGLTEEEAQAKKVAEREAANEKLQKEAAETLAKWKAEKEVKPEAEEVEEETPEDGEVASDVAPAPLEA